ncbi:putative secretion ATPase, PEP-CTERM locus subfamily [Desulfuromusa kysingii]|uniref:Putative secretion ATPase, PEP-CTERM locus subfamily n=1 Tax=Desulfuromusa kysingii TaxID=37625 RepID=A0A1H4B8Z3_9BACT|nr:XrtA/PEP-CTERM system-associated ATPase [Desulfuromusa kysingii]SEA44610.1 putative secretion ATPase, PEP-CTERM locus subfamily [Desulfuromusa kysingii]
MYTEFFGLSAKPFDLLPNPKFLYLSKGHRKALSYLQYGVQENAGFTLLTGEVGSGKTTLLRDIINKISTDVTLSMIFNTRVDGYQLVAMINTDFGLETKGKDKVELITDLNDFLLEECTSNRQPIIIIDEAQNLSEEGLEEIRLLSNLEADNFKMVQIILVGQPELKQIIAKPSLRQLRQRISISCHLNPLNREETEEYIYHRLATVGNRDCVTFQDGVIDAIFRFSGGVPRLINLICDFLLLSAFVEETKVIDMDLVQDALTELSFDEPVMQGSGFDASSGPHDPVDLNSRLARIEDNYAKLNANRSEKEAILERLSSQGSILEYLINQQQTQFGQFDDHLKKISAQIDRLRQSLLVDGKRSSIEESMGLRSKIE